MKTYTAKPSNIKNGWFLVDASGKTLGRLASQIAARLRGKHKPEFTPHMDVGDYVVVINAEKIAVTGKKPELKLYHNHSGYSGGMKVTKYRHMLERRPTYILEHAIKGMLPKNPLGRQMFRKLKVYAGTEHEHQAQQPQALDLGE